LFTYLLTYLHNVTVSYRNWAFNRRIASRVCEWIAISVYTTEYGSSPPIHILCLYYST